MPNDNNSQNPNTSNVSSDVSGVTPTDSTNPPVPPSDDMPFSAIPLNDNAPLVENQVTANAPSDEALPVGIPPVVTPPPKKKMSGGKIVGAILGLLLLVGGVGAGVLLVQQQQDIREKAAEIGESCSSGGQSGTCLTLVQCGQQNGNWLGTVGGCTGSSGCCTGVGGSTGGTQCSGATAGAGGCVPNSYSCNNSYGQMDCPSGQKCGVSCQSSGNCSGVTAGSGGCVPASWSCNNEYGQQDCGSGNKCGVSCTSGGGNPPGGTLCPTGQCYNSDGTCSDGNQYYSCINSTQRGFCNGTSGTWEYRDDPTCSGSTGGGGGDCRYEINGGTVSAVGADCGNYTFRALVFECNGPSSLGSNGRCEDKGIHPGFQSIITDTPGATSVNIGTVPACKSRQADLIVTNRPDDGFSGDDLPGVPRVANFIIQDGDQSNCGGTTSSPSPGTSPSNRAQCSAVMAYDTNWNQLGGTQLNKLKSGDKVRFTITGTKQSGTFTKARFKVNQASAVEVTAKKPGSTEVFYYEYTIPAGSTTFQVGAAIYHDSLGWIPNIIN